MWLYPRIIVSKSHENTSKHVDTVNLFAKTWTKGHWPLDDPWPHICWGHRCHSTQGSLCPSPMGIHQCMWIQWSILQKLPYTYTYIHTPTYTYILRTESVITVSFWTTFRRDKARILAVLFIEWNIYLGESWGMANTFLLGLINATYMHDLKSLVYNHKEQVKYY